MAIQPKTPLEFLESGSNFHRKHSLYQRIKLNLDHSRDILKISGTGVYVTYTLTYTLYFWF